MAIKDVSELRTGKVKLDLTGPDGNAYALMGYAQQFSRQMNIDPEPIIKRMKSGDYENLLKVFDEEFGEFVDLYR